MLDTKKGVVKKLSSHIFLFAEDCRATTSGWQGAPCFRRYGREMVSKSAISANNTWRGLP